MKIRLPATSANMGPGFDVMGLALNMYNEIEFKKAEKSSIFDDVFEGNMKDNLIYQTYIYTLKELGTGEIPAEIKSKSHIPPSRGLGSSSACIVGGIVGAYVMSGREIDRDEILNLATKIEGHPDNVAPCIKGGIVASTVVDEKIISMKIPSNSHHKHLALIPDFELSTKKARAVLPKEIPLSDGIFNTSRLAILISSLALGEDRYLKYAFEDKFHTPYRMNLIPDCDKIFEFLEGENILGSYISGAGPTLMVLADEKNTETKENIEKFLKSLSTNWEIEELEVDYNGFQIL